MDPHYATGSGSAAAVGRHPIHPLLVPLPIGLLMGALVADIVFAMTQDPFWARGAYWLLVGGGVTGVLAGAAGLVELLGVRRARRLGIAWAHGLGNLAVLVLTGVNIYIRTGAPEAAVVPAGLALSAVVVLGLGVTGWLGGEMTYRHGIGVTRRLGAPQEAPPGTPQGHPAE
ncbi:putative membrane protein [Chelatococcus caeni]|uniref:Putative membrane protein n=1 Tax=Chelatococcus caeni TaxID=1348468 RepID=A0A840BV45_9HYPH|nr:DUF2231 domain-containing protein [Chelatococcus caeni]MBB4016433.1 putative membrane protein [Chelatococcus caeni]